jgi:hypothetical protein
MLQLAGLPLFLLERKEGLGNWGVEKILKTRTKNANDLAEITIAFWVYSPIGRMKMKNIFF